MTCFRIICYHLAIDSTKLEAARNEVLCLHTLFVGLLVTPVVSYAIAINVSTLEAPNMAQVNFLYIGYTSCLIQLPGR